MISEIDIHDWDEINIPKAYSDLDDLDGLTHPDGRGERADKYFNSVKKFIESVELLRDKQIKSVPALFRPISALEASQKILTKYQNGFTKEVSYPKLSDGCCHRTVTERCSDCIHKKGIDG